MIPPLEEDEPRWRPGPQRRERTAGYPVLSLPQLPARPWARVRPRGVATLGGKAEPTAEP